MSLLSRKGLPAITAVAVSRCIREYVLFPPGCSPPGTVCNRVTFEPVLQALVRERILRAFSAALARISIEDLIRRAEGDGGK